MWISTKYYINKISIILFTLISLITILSFLNFNLRKNNSYIKINHLQNGDLVLRCGRSLESYAVYLTDSEPEFSHIGIIKFENSTPYVIHAVPNKSNYILKEKFSTFTNSKKCSKYAVYRAKLNTNTLNKIADEAQSFYNLKYTFDNAYDLKSNSELYCSELVYKAFKKAGVELQLSTKELNYILGKHAVLFPSEFTKNPIFYKII